MAQEAANEETKSSAGDKYETGRAMAQLEIEKGSVRLAEARKLKAALSQISRPMDSGVVRLGSLVVTNQGNYFLAVPVGRLELNGTEWFVISPASPIGTALMGTRPGQQISFQKKNISVMQVD